MCITSIKGLFADTIASLRIKREGILRIEPINTNTSFGWKINQQISHYGNNMMKSTEYYRDNGLKLVVVDSFRNGKQVTKTKELYNNKWQLLKCKIIEFVNGKKDKSYYI